MLTTVKNLTLKTCGQLAYRQRGLPCSSGPTYVFLHGNGFSSAVFDGLLSMPELADKHSIAFDLPGHGASQSLAAGTAYTFENMGDRLIKALNALNLTDVILIGWSLGGHIALDMLDRSDRISRAMIMGAPPMHRGPLSTLWAFHFSLDMLLVSKRQFTTTDAARFEKLVLGSAACGEHIAALQSVDPVMRPSVARGLLHGANRDQHALALNADKPLMILQGADDPLVRASFLNNFAKTDGFMGQYALIEQAGHAPFLDQPEAFCTQLDKFVRQPLAAKGSMQAAA